MYFSIGDKVWRSKTSVPEQYMNQPQPTFSIVVPTYNRPEKLISFLRALVLMDYPRDRFEVIVVDDGGRTTLGPEVAAFKNDLNIVLLSAAHGGPAKARQTGIDIARGRFLAFTDDDCAPDVNWLNTLETVFNESPDAAVGGQTINALKDNPYSSASQLLITYLYRFYNADPNHARYFATNNLALPAEHFRAMGGLDLTWSISGGEDRDLCERWLRKGYPMTYVPEALIYHAHELTFRSFLRQHFNYGRGAFRYHYVQSYPQKENIKLEPFSFYLRLPLFAFSQMPANQAGLIAMLLVISQGANTAGFFSEWLGSLWTTKRLMAEASRLGS
ncbi:MAG: glycosyltransferase [Pyrinomonadaceae bacterium]